MDYNKISFNSKTLINSYHNFIKSVLMKFVLMKFVLMKCLLKSVFYTNDKA